MHRVAEYIWHLVLVALYVKYILLAYVIVTV